MKYLENKDKNDCSIQKEENRPEKIGERKEERNEGGRKKRRKNGWK